MMNQFLQLKKNTVDYCHFYIFITESFVKHVQIIQNFKIIHALDQVMNEKRIVGCI
jgi:hypothetical protein